jgi:hypothetical protein
MSPPGLQFPLCPAQNNIVLSITHGGGEIAAIDITLIPIQLRKPSVST